MPGDSEQRERDKRLLIWLGLALVYFGTFFVLSLVMLP